MPHDADTGVEPEFDMGRAMDRAVDGVQRAWRWFQACLAALIVALVLKALLTSPAGAVGSMEDPRAAAPPAPELRMLLVALACPTGAVVRLETDSPHVLLLTVGVYAGLVSRDEFVAGTAEDESAGPAFAPDFLRVCLGVGEP
ncbi:MAG: hypothetical protein SFV21_00185 [Rhodospirillaceae bacterium]|nr:hypothetical protein [Rhodospirillaceae bacterium]